MCGIDLDGGRCLEVVGNRLGEDGCAAHRWILVVSRIDGIPGSFPDEVGSVEVRAPLTEIHGTGFHGQAVDLTEDRLAEWLELGGDSGRLLDGLGPVAHELPSAKLICCLLVYVP